MKTEIVETCPHCDTEVIMNNWDVEKDGYQAICPRCANKLMLCDECLNAEDNPYQKCDWCEGKGCWREKSKTPNPTV